MNVRATQSLTKRTNRFYGWRMVPCQTMATHWFDRYRGRVVATVLTAGGIVGFLVTWYNTRMLHVASWRTGFTSYAILALLLAGIARIFIRNRPEEKGLPEELSPKLLQEIESPGQSFPSEPPIISE